MQGSGDPAPQRRGNADAHLHNHGTLAAGRVWALSRECGLSPAPTREAMSKVCSALNGWRGAARRHGVRAQEIAMMAEAIQPRLETVRAEAAS